MSLTRTTLLTAAAAIAALTMTGGAFAKTFEAVYTVNIHKSASKGSHIVDKLFEGERVKVQECDDAWCLIDHEGPDGWVPLASLERVGGASAAPTIIVQGGFNFAPKPKQPLGIIDTPRPPPKHKTPVVLGTINHGTPTAGGHCIVGHPCTISN